MPPEIGALLPEAGAAGAATPARAWRRHLLAVVACCLLALALNHGALAGAVRVWTGSVTYRFGMLAPFVVVLWLWWLSPRLATVRPSLGPMGLPVVAAGAALAALAESFDILVVQQLALVALWQALVLTLLGRRAFLALLAPLLYLYFAVPQGQELIAPLQAFTAEVSVLLTRLAGIPAQTDGVLIHAGGAVFHVTEACAGLRFLLVALAIGVLIAMFWFRSWRARLAFVALSLALPLIANALRVAGLIVLVETVGLQAALRVDHLTYGMVFSLALLVVQVAVAVRFGGSPVRPEPEPAGETEAPVPAGRLATIGAAAALLTLVPALAVRAL
jgi:exosortase